MAAGAAPEQAAPNTGSRQQSSPTTTMASIVLKSLSVLLGIFFIFVGTTKLTPKISKELHKDLVSTAERFFKVIFHLQLR